MLLPRVFHRRGKKATAIKSIYVYVLFLSITKGRTDSDGYKKLVNRVKVILFMIPVYICKTSVLSSVSQYHDISKEGKRMCTYHSI